MENEQAKLKILFKKMKKIDSFFPITFKSGHKLDGIQAICERCDMPFFGEMLHGTVEFNKIDRARVSAIGQCDCGHYDEFVINFHDEVDDIYAIELLETGWKTRPAFVAQSLTSIIGLAGYGLGLYYSVKYRIVYSYRKSILKIKQIFEGEKNATN